MLKTIENFINACVNNREGFGTERMRTFSNCPCIICCS